MHASDDARFCSSKRGRKPSRVTQQQRRLRLGAEGRARGLQLVGIDSAWQGSSWHAARGWS